MCNFVYDIFNGIGYITYHNCTHVNVLHCFFLFQGHTTTTQPRFTRGGPFFFQHRPVRGLIVVKSITEMDVYDVYHLQYTHSTCTNTLVSDQSLRDGILQTIQLVDTFNQKSMTYKHTLTNRYHPLRIVDRSGTRPTRHATQETRDAGRPLMSHWLHPRDPMTIIIWWSHPT